MPIRPFLNGRRFNQETLRILSVAFEQVCITLQIEGSADDVNEAIANKVIELASACEHNPDILCERVLEGIRRPADELGDPLPR